MLPMLLLLLVVLSDGVLTTKLSDNAVKRLVWNSFATSLELCFLCVYSLVCYVTNML